MFFSPSVWSNQGKLSCALHSASSLMCQPWPPIHNAGFALPALRHLKDLCIYTTTTTKEKVDSYFYSQKPASLRSGFNHIIFRDFNGYSVFSLVIIIRDWAPAKACPHQSRFRKGEDSIVFRMFRIIIIIIIILPPRLELFLLFFFLCFILSSPQKHACIFLD